ncbi:hypothetical protein PgNI_05722 [Pyricularia grisea]|uniref:Uncharacterized protein n=1 Tax=Pyricularia grisea TaxID=148305 RepID=A0A6P8B7G2_PYRGI|nr:hypothetical protein PgNI_05722 [Pyricularia grisea]TLD11183.1 hypothetical protein PgNI_05722 [Pyricularia grisea]
MTTNTHQLQGGPVGAHSQSRIIDALENAVARARGRVGTHWGAKSGRAWHGNVALDVHRPEHDVGDHLGLAEDATILSGAELGRQIRVNLWDFRPDLLSRHHREGDEEAQQRSWEP